MPTGYITVEIELDWSTLYELLDDIAEHVNGLPNEKLLKFIRNAFYFTNNSVEGAKFRNIIFKPKSRYIKLLPALKAGDITFDDLCNLLTKPDDFIQPDNPWPRK